MQKKANIYAPSEGNNEGWIVEIIDANNVTGFHYMDWNIADWPNNKGHKALELFSSVSDFFPAEYLVSVFINSREMPTLRGKVLDGKILGYKYA